ncbi:threonine/serine exporter family protein, partial [Eubacteriales bacterium OttesenSCG-928-G02]|nr:threonine/serine exporter family protein [Eubacteriales bacterium OttesenSCG-928-G02]
MTRTLFISENDNENYLTLALTLAGEMIKNGGETYRAEECASKILYASKARDVQVFAIPTSILITVAYEAETITRSLTVGERDINLKNIDRLNTISRNICEGKITLSEACEKLE